MSSPYHIGGRRRGLSTAAGVIHSRVGRAWQLWGYDQVFAGPDLPRFARDVRVRVGSRTIYLDVYCPEARVNFELDGAKYHASARDRERDARRDAALAAMGIMVVRFTHDQLVHSPDLVRAQIRAIVSTRLDGTPGGSEFLPGLQPIR